MALNALRIKALSKKGLYLDSHGLYLQVSSTATKSWIFRYMLNGKTRNMGLGPVDLVSLAKAREKTLELRKQTYQGIDPLEQRRAAQTTPKPQEHSFAAVMEQYLDSHRAGWSSDTHAKQWQSTLTTYALPVIGQMDVAKITTGDVLDVLKPIWNDKTETASRVRGRVEAILSYAKSLGWRSGFNPAAWDDNLKPLLPSPSKVAPTEHHPALPWLDMPAFWSALCKREISSSNLALRFLILTATRTDETLGTRWDEIDISNKVWTIPAARMKGKKLHRVPLSEGAVAILESLDRTSDYAFPGAKSGEPLSNMALTQLLRKMGQTEITVHGFRSTFKEWASENTNHDNIVSEMALAHAVSSKVEAAYRRGELYEKRTRLMRDWNEYCFGAAACSAAA